MVESTRRAVLAGLGSSLTAIAGCNSSSDGSSPAETPTPTPESTPTASATPTAEPTPTRTPEPRSPSVESVSLVSRWENFGDAEQERVNAVGQGATAIIAYRFQAGVHDGTIDTTEQVKIFSNETGKRVALNQDTGEQLVEASGYQTWEHALTFDTAEWDVGGYTAQILVRDNIINKTSETVESQFIVNEPLTGNEARLVDVEGPDTVRVGERYEYTLTLENTSKRDGSVVSSVSARYPDTDWSTYNFEVATTMAAGQRNTWPGYFQGFNYEGTVEFRLNSIGDTWSVDVIS